MPSQHKKNKQKNAYGAYGILKNKVYRCKRFLFYTSSDRQLNKKIKNVDDC